MKINEFYTRQSNNFYTYQTIEVTLDSKMLNESNSPHFMGEKKAFRNEAIITVMPKLGGNHSN